MAEDQSADIILSIRQTLCSMDLKKPILSTLAQKGDDELVQTFMAENIQLGNGTFETIQSQLYIAAFWGLHDVMKTLIDNGADPNGQNATTNWTPLHAATFQEHGKVIMLLLERGADPEIEDYQGRTPKDFASASDKIWSLFAARGCKRTNKHELVQKRILQQSNYEQAAYSNMDTGRKSTASSLLSFDDQGNTSAHNNTNAYAAAMNGDVLADYSDKLSMTPSKQNPSADQPSFSAWRS